MPRCFSRPIYTTPAAPSSSPDPHPASSSPWDVEKYHPLRQPKNFQEMTDDGVVNDLLAKQNPTCKVLPLDDGLFNFQSYEVTSADGSASPKDPKRVNRFIPLGSAGFVFSFSSPSSNTEMDDVQLPLTPTKRADSTTTPSNQGIGKKQGKRLAGSPAASPLYIRVPKAARKSGKTTGATNGDGDALCDARSANEPQGLASPSFNFNLAGETGPEAHHSPETANGGDRDTFDSTTSSTFDEGDGESILHTSAANDTVFTSTHGIGLGISLPPTAAVVDDEPEASPMDLALYEHKPSPLTSIAFSALEFLDKYRFLPTSQFLAAPLANLHQCIKMATFHDSTITLSALLSAITDAKALLELLAQQQHQAVKRLDDLAEDLKRVGLQNRIDLPIVMIDRARAKVQATETDVVEMEEV